MSFSNLHPQLILIICFCFFCFLDITVFACGFLFYHKNISLNKPQPLIMGLSNSVWWATRLGEVTVKQHLRPLTGYNGYWKLRLLFLILCFKPTSEHWSCTRSSRRRPTACLYTPPASSSWWASQTNCGSWTCWWKTSAPSRSFPSAAAERWVTLSPAAGQGLCTALCSNCCCCRSVRFQQRRPHVRSRQWERGSDLRSHVVWEHSQPEGPQRKGERITASLFELSWDGLKCVKLDSFRVNWIEFIWTQFNLIGWNNSKLIWFMTTLKKNQWSEWYFKSSELRRIELN